MTPAIKNGTIAFLALIVAGGTYYLWNQRQGSATHAPAAPASGAAVATGAAPISAPASQPDGAVAVSDAGLAAEVATALGFSALPDFVYTDGVVRRFVATVDALPREQLPLTIRAIRPLGGAFKTKGDEDHPRIAAANAARYAALVAAFEQIPPVAAGDLYQRLYPRLQQSYEELGFPGRSFHTRVLEVIDNLLAAPDAREAAPLARPNVMFLYADPALERCTAGQKALLRSGPLNEARIKAQLRLLRAEIASHAPH
jgi:hypothetical protein